MDRDISKLLVSFLCNMRNVINQAKQLSQILTREIPVIIEQPENQTTRLNQYVTFTVKAENISSYQWQFLNPSVSDDWRSSTAQGNQTDSLYIQATNARFAMSFKCKMTGIDGTVIYSDVVKMVKEN